MMQTQTAPTTPISVSSLHQQQQQQQNAMYVGPYRLEKTLGKGQTGLVKLGIHHKNGKKVAIKIVNREKLSDSVLMKVEREITIMKLIEHPHVLRLYDVYENKKYLYLVLEHVSGGELFDYLVKKSRLSTKEARKFFKQIISALDFCHSHLICHRDLKPENLLLDDKLNIKIADFGMASLQVDGSMLETSCGSPHYACPEVIRGEKYDGRKADVWSCGVILYALLVGALPFDDDNLKVLLEKIKKGTFQIPSYVPQECQELLNRMIEVDPNKRMTLEEVNKHQWVLAGSREEIELELPMSQVVQTAIIPSIDSIDTDVLANMTSLGCFKDQSKLVENLLNERHNTEKVIYFLLLDRKFKNPCSEDNDEVFIRNKSVDAPRKRIDKFKTSSPGVYSQLAIGSPAIPRRGMPITHGRHQSCHTTPLQSPCTSPLVSNREYHFRNYDTGSIHSGSHSYRHTSSNQQNKQQHHHHPPSLTSQSSTEQDNVSLSSNNSINFNQQLRSKINSVKNHLFSTPKFYKRKSSERSNEQQQSVSQQASTATTPSTSVPTSQQQQQQQTSSSALSTPTTDSKSWFQRWNFSNTNYNNNNNNNSNNNKDSSSTNGSSNSPATNSQQDKEYIHIINDRPFNNLKADLIHVLLKTTDLIHNIITPTVFRCEYRSPDKFLSRNVRFKVEVITENLSKPLTDIENKPLNQTCKIVFTLMSGSSRQFQTICKNICQALCSSQITNIYQRQKRQEQRQQQQQQQQQQQVQQNSANTNAISNSINHVLQQQQQQQQVQQPNRASFNTSTSRRNSNTSTNGILNAPSPSSTSSSTSSTSSSASSSSASAASTTAVGSLSLNNSATPQPGQQTTSLNISNIESLQVSSNKTPQFQENVSTTTTFPYNPLTPTSATTISNNNVNRTRRNSNTSMNSPTLNSTNFMFHPQYQQQLQQPQSQQQQDQSNNSISSISNFVSSLTSNTTTSSSSINNNNNNNNNLYTQPMVTTSTTNTTTSSLITNTPIFSTQNKTQSQTSITSSSKSSSSNSMNTTTTTTTSSTTKAQASANIAAAALSAMSIKAALFTTIANNITNFNQNNNNTTTSANNTNTNAPVSVSTSTTANTTTNTTTANTRNSNSNTSIFSSSSILDLFR